MPGLESVERCRYTGYPSQDTHQSFYLLELLTAYRHTDQPIGNKYSATPVDLQLPPTLAGRRNSIWHAPPYGWIFGNWKVTYSSQPTYQDLYNFQIDWSPVLPYDAGKRNRLTSYQTQNASRILTTFGYDIPDPIDPNSVADFFPTGPLGPLNNSDEIIAWGYDTDGLSYLVVYETAVVAEPAPPGIDVFSRSETGPSNVTLQAIIQGFLGM